MRLEDRLIVALDVSDKHEAARMVRAVDSLVEWFKVGLGLLSAGDAHDVVRFIHGRNKKVFADFKPNDTPNTVEMAVRNISEKLKAEIFSITVKTENSDMATLIKANRARGASKMFGVGPLTSDSLTNIIMYEKIIFTAQKIYMSGADGVICPAVFAKEVKGEFTELQIMSPAIRPEWFKCKDDQIWTCTPAQAIDFGADYLVAGRPIWSAPENIGGPLGAVEKILKEIAKAGK